MGWIKRLFGVRPIPPIPLDDTYIFEKGDTAWIWFGDLGGAVRVTIVLDGECDDVGVMLFEVEGREPLPEEGPWGYANLFRSPAEAKRAWDRSPWDPEYRLEPPSGP